MFKANRTFLCAVLGNKYDCQIFVTTIQPIKTLCYYYDSMGLLTILFLMICKQLFFSQGNWGMYVVQIESWVRYIFCNSTFYINHYVLGNVAGTCLELKQIDLTNTHIPYFWFTCYKHNT